MYLNSAIEGATTTFTSKIRHCDNSLGLSHITIQQSICIKFVLPQFSKILEKLYNNRLDMFINKCNILSPSQYEFRSSMSTTEALLDLVEEITTSLDKNKYTVGVFIDLKKAFDTVDQDILCKKTHFYGLHAVAQKWIHSYLENRKQFVSSNNCLSEILYVLCGVPQGSILLHKNYLSCILMTYVKSHKCSIIYYLLMIQIYSIML